MNGTPSSNRLLRRSRLVAWGTAVGASVASAGLILGITHTASQAATAKSSTGTTTTSTTSTGTSSTSGTSSSNTGSNLGSVSQGQAAQGGSHGS
jgi:hypothetical protein